MGTTNVVRAANAKHDPKWPDEQLAVSVDAFSVELGNHPATAWHVTTQFHRVVEDPADDDDLTLDPVDEEVAGTANDAHVRLCLTALVVCVMCLPNSVLVR